MIGLALCILNGIVGLIFGWIPNGGVPRTAIIALLPYAVLLVVTLLFNAVRAPAKMDNRRTVRIGLLRRSARRRFTELRDAKNGELSRLTERLRQAEATPKAPPISVIEQRRRDLVAEYLKPFDADEIKALRHVLESGQVNVQQLELRFGGPTAGMWRRLLNKGIPTGLVKADSRMLRINPELVNALAFHLLGK